MRGAPPWVDLGRMSNAYETDFYAWAMSRRRRRASANSIRPISTTSRTRSKHGAGGEARTRQPAIRRPLKWRFQPVGAILGRAGPGRQLST